MELFQPLSRGPYILILICYLRTYMQGYRQYIFLLQVLRR